MTDKTPTPEEKMQEIPPKTLTYYEWKDVEKYICQKLGIPQEKFRDYNEIMGGEYLDLWYTWLEYNFDTIRNGIILRHYHTWTDDPDPRLIQFNKILREIFNPDTPIYIEYSW
jgi:hypothetical protein